MPSNLTFFAFSSYRVKLSTKCFKKGEHLVIDGEAVAILPSLSRE